MVEPNAKEEQFSIAMYRMTDRRFEALRHWGVRLLSSEATRNGNKCLRDLFNDLNASQNNIFDPYVGKRRKLWSSPEDLCDFSCRHLREDLPAAAVEWALLPELGGALHGMDDELRDQRPQIHRIGH